MDAVGSNIRLDSRGKEVMRILPRVNEAINEEWISDKTRQHVDGLRLQRLDRPFVRENGRLRPASWNQAFAAIAARVKGTDPTRIGAIAGDLAGVEEMFALKLLVEGLGSKNVDCRQDGSVLSSAHGRGSYIFNPTIAGIEDADAILIVGSNPRLEGADHQPAHPEALADLADADRPDRPQGRPDLPLRASGRRPGHARGLGRGPPQLLPHVGARRAAAHPRRRRRDHTVRRRRRARCGRTARIRDRRREGRLERLCGPAYGRLARRWARSRLRAGGRRADGPAMAASGGLDVLFNLGADEIEIAPGAFVIYQGSHGDRGAHRADVILPARPIARSPRPS
jgi:NADH-quinone oxidoreductase subunit G